MTGARIILLCACIATGLLPVAGRAHEGHDDGASPASSLPGINVPRVEAQSDLFEIVGVVEGDAMKIFLDRYATNEPVVDATIDVEAGALKGSAQANPDGTYTFRTAALAQVGPVPVTFTIAAGSDGDLLTGDLVAANPDAAQAHAGDDPLRERWWWYAAALLIAGGVVSAWRSRRRRNREIVR
jgi:membrane fusion protein, heavy metal efflux system